MKLVIYLSYDLGVSGDYPGLYTWLAKLNALECGDSFCRFVYDFETVAHMESLEDTKKALKELLKAIKEAVKLKVNDRIYVCSEFYVKDKKTLTGCFIYGKRKQNPWQGYEKENTNFQIDN